MWAVFVPTRLHRRLKPHISPSGLYDPFKTIASFPCSSTFPPLHLYSGPTHFTHPNETKRNEASQNNLPPPPSHVSVPTHPPLNRSYPIFACIHHSKATKPRFHPRSRKSQLYPPCHAEHILYKSKRGMMECRDGRGVLIVREKAEGGGVSTWKILIRRLVMDGW